MSLHVAAAVAPFRSSWLPLPHLGAAARRGCDPTADL